MTKRKKTNYMILKLLKPLIHFFLILLVFYLIYRLRLKTDLIPWIQLPIPIINRQETIIFAIISWITFLWIWIIKKLYELNKETPNYFQTFTKVRLYRITTITFIWYFWNWFIFKYWLSRFIIIVWAISSFIVILIFDQIRNKIENQKNKNGNQKILIVWDNTEKSYDVIWKIQKWFTYKTEFIQLNDLWDIDLTKYIIVIAAWIFQKEDLQNLLEKLRFSYTKFYHISEWFFLEDVVYKPTTIWNLVAMEYNYSTLDWRYIIWKRICDIIISIIWIIILSPLMIIISILIKLDSKWPILFVQKRVWKGWKQFTFLKFRSMVQNAEDLKKNLIKQNERSGPLFKIKNDPRITKFWRFLRKTSIDELPQLFCVLAGTMSIIWPRPHLPEEVKNYETRQKRLLSVKPWISWYAQIFWRDKLSFEEEAKLDLYYIQNRNMFLDLYVILATVKVVFKGK